MGRSRLIFTLGGGIRLLFLDLLIMDFLLRRGLIELLLLLLLLLLMELRLLKIHIYRRLLSLLNVILGYLIHIPKETSYSWSIKMQK